MLATPQIWSSIGFVPDSDAHGAFQPYITQLTNGNVLFAWTSNGPPSPTNQNGTDIRGRLFDPFGVEIGSEIRLNILAPANE